MGIRVYLLMYISLIVMNHTSCASDTSTASIPTTTTATPTSETQDTILISKAGMLLIKEHGLVVNGHETIGLSIADNLKRNHNSVNCPPVINKEFHDIYKNYASSQLETAGFRYKIVEPTNKVPDINRVHQKLLDDPSAELNAYIQSDSCFCDTATCGCWLKDQKFDTNFKTTRKFSFDLYNTPNETLIQISVQLGRPLPPNSNGNVNRDQMEIGPNTALTNKLHFKNNTIFHLDIILLKSSRFEISTPIITDKEYLLTLQAVQPVDKLEFLSSSCYMTNCNPMHEYHVTILKIGPSQDTNISTWDDIPSTRKRRNVPVVATAVQSAKATVFVKENLKGIKFYLAKILYKAVKSFPDRYWNAFEWGPDLLKYVEDLPIHQIDKRSLPDDDYPEYESSNLSSNRSLEEWYFLLEKYVPASNLSDVVSTITSNITTDTEDIISNPIRTKRGVLEFFGIASEEMVEETITNYMEVTAEITGEKLQQLTDEVINDKKQLMKINMDLNQIYNDMCVSDGRVSAQLTDIQTRISIQSQTKNMIEDLNRCSNGEVPKSYTYQFITELCKSAMNNNICDTLGHKVYNLLTCSIKEIYLYDSGYLIEYSIIIPTSPKTDYTLYRPTVIPVYDNATQVWHEIMETKDYRIMVENDTTKVLSECRLEDGITVCPPIRSIQNRAKSCFTDLLAGRQAECPSKAINTDRTCFSTFIDEVGVLVSTNSDVTINQFSFAKNRITGNKQIVKTGVFLIQNHQHHTATINCHGETVTTMFTHTGTIRTINVKQFDWAYGLSQNYNKITQLNNSVSVKTKELQDQIDNLKISFSKKLVDEFTTGIKEFAPSNPDKYRAWVAILAVISILFLIVIIYFIKCICQAKIQAMSAPIQTIRTRFRRRRKSNTGDEELEEF